MKFVSNSKLKLPMYCPKTDFGCKCRYFFIPEKSLRPTIARTVENLGQPAQGTHNSPKAVYFRRCPTRVQTNGQINGFYQNRNLEKNQKMATISKFFRIFADISQMTHQ